MREQWNCSVCGYSCPRHWNLQRHIDRNHPGTGQRPVKYSMPNSMQFKTPIAAYYTPYHNPFQQYPSNIKSSTLSPYDRKLKGPKENEEKNNKRIILLRNGTKN